MTFGPLAATRLDFYLWLYHRKKELLVARIARAETPTVLSVTALRKQYGDLLAVDGIFFEVRSKEIVGLLGPNGAGKTTTISMILGVLEPTAGEIRIEGVDLGSHRSQALERTNFAAVYTPLPGNLTVEQNLRIFGLLYGVRKLHA